MSAETIPDEHDPLCHMAGRDPNEVYMFSIPCECETIQRVRADERRKVAEEIGQAIEAERTVLYGQRLQDPRQWVGLTRAAAIARRIGGAS